MAIIPMAPENLFQAALVQLLRDCGQLTDDETLAYVEVPDVSLLALQNPQLFVQRNVGSNSWRIAVAVEQPKEEPKSFLEI